MTLALHHYYYYSRARIALAIAKTDISVVLLWLPNGIGQTIISSSCGFFLSSIFFSSPNLSGRTLDVYHTSTHRVALV